MNITVQWDNDEHTIIRYDVASQWDVDDLFAAFRADDEFFAGAEHTIHLIIDLTHVETSPPQLTSIMREASDEIDPLLGLVVAVKADLYLQSMLTLFHDLFASNRPGLAGVMFANTLDEARQIIAAFNGKT